MVLYHPLDYGGTVAIPGTDVAVSIRVAIDNSGPHTAQEVKAYYTALTQPLSGRANCCRKSEHDRRGPARRARESAGGYSGDRGHLDLRPGKRSRQGGAISRAMPFAGGVAG